MLKYLFFFICTLYYVNIPCQDQISFVNFSKQLNVSENNYLEAFYFNRINPCNPDELIVLMPWIEEEDEESFIISGHIYILDRNTKEIKSSLTEKSIATTFWSDAIRLEEISLDTNDYSIGQMKKAFAIKSSYRGSSSSNPYSSSSLTLFEVQNDSVKILLDNLETELYHGEWNMRCSGEFWNRSMWYRFSQNITNNYYDIELFQTTTLSHNYLDENGECLTRAFESEISLPTMTFICGKYR